MNKFLQFFDQRYSTPMPIFGKMHYTLIFLTIISVILVYINKEKLKELNQDKVRKTFGWILLGNMILHYVALVLNGTWTYVNDLPLHLCYITNFIFIYTMFTNNKKNTFSFIYYFTLIGPGPAVIWSDLNAIWDNYRFYQFIISHHVMIVFSFYSLYVLMYKSDFKGARNAFFMGHILVAIMYIFNQVFNTNYIMMKGLPDVIVGLYPWTDMLPPLVWLEIVGLLAFGLSYIPVKLYNEKTIKQ